MKPITEKVIAEFRDSQIGQTCNAVLTEAENRMLEVALEQAAKTAISEYVEKYQASDYQ